VSQLTGLNVFVTGTTINAAPFNTNFNLVQTAVNNIDNSNIGSVGLFASQIIPTSSAQATFGGSQSYSFPLNILAPSGFIAAGTAPAAILAGDLSAARSSTTAALFMNSTGSQFIDFGLTTANTFTINGANLNVPNVIRFGASGLASLQTNATQTEFIPASSTQPFVFANAAGSAANLTINNAGGALLAPSGSSTQGNLPPVYAVAGTAFGNNVHIVTGQALSVGGTGAATITLSGSAAFASSSSYQVAAMALNAGSNIAMDCTITSGTSFTLNSSSGPGVTYSWIAIGI
jgi:hypothetical protein